MVKSPNARPIKVRHLQSLDAAKAFAQGLLAEFDYVAEQDMPVTVGGDPERTHRSRVASIRPQPQTT